MSKRGRRWGNAKAKGEACEVTSSSALPAEPTPYSLFPFPPLKPFRTLRSTSAYTGRM